LPKYFPNLLAIKAFLSILYIALTVAVAWCLGYGMDEWLLLLTLLFNAVLVQLILFLRSNVAGLGYYRLDSLLSAFDKLLMLFTCGFLLWVTPQWLSIESFTLAQTLALLLTSVIVFIILRSKAAFSVRPSWVGNWRAGRPVLTLLLRKSFPYALVVLLMFAYTRLDGVLLERLLPDGRVHAEVFAGAYRLLDACNMFGFMFASLLLPMFARLLKDADPAGIRSLVSLAFNLLWVASITTASVVFLARQELLHLMMPDRASAYRWDTLGVLIWAFVPVSLTYIFGTLLTAREALRTMNRVFVAGIVVNASLNALLIPHFQALGAAWAAVATQAVVAAGLMGLSAHIFHFKPHYTTWLRVLGFALFVVGINAWIFVKTPLAWEVKSVSGLAAGFVGAILFNMIDVRGALRLVGK
jgi:O-antigen/teichoic acid export membrane protein